MSEFHSLDELNKFWEDTLNLFVGLRARYLFYTALKEYATTASNSTQYHGQDPELEQSSAAELSRIESEKDTHYSQTISSLQAEIRVERGKCDELRDLLRQLLLDIGNASQQHKYDREDLHALEAECTEVETRLNTYTDTAARIDQLNSTNQKLQDRQDKIRHQIAQTNAACRESKEYRQSLEAREQESLVTQSKEIDRLNKFIKILS